MVLKLYFFVKNYRINWGNASIVPEFYCDQNPKDCTEYKQKISMPFITDTKPKYFSGYQK